MTAINCGAPHPDDHSETPRFVEDWAFSDVQQTRLVYTLEQALSFNHQHKLKDDEINSMNRVIQACNNNQNEQHFKYYPVTPPPVQRGPSTTSILNKLTMEKFDSVLAEIAALPGFGSAEATELFVKSITEVATAQQSFIPMYTRFITAYKARLSTPEQQESLELYLTEYCSDAQLKNPSQAFFIGSLAREKLVQLYPIYELVQHFASDNADNSLEILYNLLLTAGLQIEQSFSDSKKVFSEVQSKADSPSVSTRIKFMLKDLMMARDDHWNTEPLIPKALTLEQAKRYGAEHQISILDEYAESKTVTTRCDRKTAKEMFISIAQSSRKNFDRVVGVFDCLKSKMSADVATKAITEAILQAKTESRDFPVGVRRCGSILARLIHSKIVSETEFGTKIPFDIEVLGGLLEEMDNIDECESLLRMKWFRDLKFLPPIYAQFPILSELIDIGMTDLFPEYNLAYKVWKMMGEQKNPSDVYAELGNAKEVSQSKVFVEFATEMVVMHMPLNYVQSLIEIIRQKPVDALKQIERIGEYHEWPVNITASHLFGLAKVVKNDMKWFLEQDGNERHQEIAKALRDCFEASKGM